MRKETAELVLPILRYGLRLKERLRHGEKCTMAAEQAELKRLFRSSKAATNAPSTVDSSEVFLGIRYPLACWLDEIFIVDSDSPWKKEWREQTMELALFGTRERAHEFWRQARQAESRGDADAVEVFYLCVMLGFRGDQRENVNALLDWRDAVEGRIDQDRPPEWPAKPSELPVPETNASPLRARDRLRWMLLTAAAVLGLATGWTVYLLITPRY
jgi:type VI secretion system protein ImpK